jgi:hypothetical protein
MELNTINLYYYQFILRQIVFTNVGLFRPLSISLTVTKDSVFTHWIKHFTMNNMWLHTRHKREMTVKDGQMPMRLHKISFTNSLKN